MSGNPKNKKQGQNKEDTFSEISDLKNLKNFIKHIGLVLLA